MAEIVDFGLQQHKIKMDSMYFENVLSVVAGDTGRRLEVQLLDTNGMVQDTTGLNLRLNAEIAGKATFTDATLVDATTGKYQLDLSNGMFLAPGNWQFQWQIIDSAGKKLHSFAFTGNIGKNISEGGSQATNFYLNLEDLKAMQDDLVNGTIDSSILETNIAEKLTNLETQYAPKLTEVTAQLAETAYRTRFQSTENEINLLSLKVGDNEGVTVSGNMPISPYGNNEYVHPDIIYFPQKWNGWRYWMVANPYKDSNENYENPCIYVSDDSINWGTPIGLTNPLYDYPGVPKHYSDPCFVLDKNGYTLHVVHRLSGAGTDNVFYKMSSDDGINWTPQQEIYRVSGREIVSPAITLVEDEYNMFFVDINDNYTLKRTTSKDLINWTSELPVTIAGTTEKIWHFELTEYGGGLIMLASNVGDNKLMLLKSRDLKTFSMSSENFLTYADIGRGLYKSSLLLYRDSGSLFLMLHANLKPSTQSPSWEIKRYLIPLERKQNVTPTKTTNFGLQYLNGLATNVEGEIVETREEKWFANNGSLTTLSFRIDFSNVDNVPSARIIVMTLPVAPKFIISYFSFPVFYIGKSANNIDSVIGVLQTDLGLVYFYKNTPTGLVAMKKEDFVGITSVRGSLSYFNKHE